jgi:hypothetical protein
MSSATVLSGKIRSSFRDHRSAAPGHTCSRATRSYRLNRGTEARVQAIGCCFHPHSEIAPRSWFLTSTAQARHPEADDTRSVGREAPRRPPQSALRARGRAVRQWQERSYGCASSLCRTDNGQHPAKSGESILFQEPTLFRSSVAVQNNFGSTLALTLNLVAVPHGGISPRTLSPMKVSADSRRRLRFRGSTLARAHPPTDPRSAGLRPGGCCDSSRNAPDRKSALRCCHQSQGQCADATLVAVPCVP